MATTRRPPRPTRRRRSPRAIEAGRIAITSNELLVQNPLIDVVIDATGKPGVAADFDLMAMEHGKHLVMMNVEADVTIGALPEAARPTGWASSIRSAPATSRRAAWS